SRAHLQGEQVLAKVVAGVTDPRWHWGRFRAAVSDRGYSADRFTPGIPKIVRAAIANAGKQFHHALERDLIARVRREAQERRHVFDVRLFKKANAARDLIRNAAAGELELQLDRVIMRAIKNGDVVQIDIFIAQLQ